ncbi:UNVERIFIED_CONTAM: hypothetical protein NCL1_23958 [Trichonephila clavipes]
MCGKADYGHFKPASVEVLSSEKLIAVIRSDHNIPLRPNPHDNAVERKKIASLTTESVCIKCKVLLFINRRWLWSVVYFQLANLALIPNTTKTRLQLIRRKNIELRSELSDLSDDDNAANKTYEPRILEGESSSDESDEVTHGNI